MGLKNNIGDTPLWQLHELAGEPLSPVTYVKDESQNPTGTHKDRKSAYLLSQALRQGVDTLAILTAGNAGYSLAKLAQGTGLRIVTIVHHHIRADIRKALEDAGASVVCVDLSQPYNSHAIEGMARSSSQERVWDVTNSGSEAYEQVWHEVKHVDPDLMVCPLGSGELFLGIAQGIKQTGARCRLIGVMPTESVSKADKLCTKFLPLQRHILEEQIAAAEESGISHGLWDIEEDEIDWCIRNAPAGMTAEPSALVPLHVVQRLRSFKNKIVIVNTGKGAFPATTDA